MGKFKSTLNKGFELLDGNMAAPLTPKNTLKQTGFALSTTGIKYRDNYYPFDEIIETRVARQVTEQRTVLVNSTFHYAISIVAVTKYGDMIQVTEQPTMFSDSKIDNIEFIETQFNEISKRTWDARIKKYLDQVNEKKFFNYGEWRFYINQKVIQHVKTEKNYHIDSCNFFKDGNFITVEEKNTGLGMRFIKSLVAKRIQISIITDRDVFYFLFRHYFGLDLSK